MHTIYFWLYEGEAWGRGNTEAEARAAARALSQGCAEDPEPEDEDPVLIRGCPVMVTGEDRAMMERFALSLSV